MLGVKLCYDRPNDLYVCGRGAGHWGGVCLARARSATFVLTIPTLTPDLPSPRRAPQVNQDWTANLRLLRVPMVGRYQYGYITPAFSRSPWWGGINMAASLTPAWGPHGGERSILVHDPCLLEVVLLGKIMILQGVGHQISGPGVCYTNDPPKRGGIRCQRLRLI